MSDLSSRKQAIRDHFDRYAESRAQWIDRSRFFHESDRRYMRFLVPEGASVLDLGCGTGRMLDALKPSRGVGIDLSPRMIEMARANYPSDTYPAYTFVTGDIENAAFMEELGRTLGDRGGETFDYIVLSDTIGSLEDCEAALRALHGFCHPDTRIIVAYYSHLWEPLLRLAEQTGHKMPQLRQNWLAPSDIINLLSLADFEEIGRDWRQLLPASLGGLGRFINRYIGTLPLIRRLCLRNYIVARPAWNQAVDGLSATVVVPCRNERGNIRAIAERIPDFCEDLEILFVEGNSVDGTWEEINRVMADMAGRNIRALQQPGKGKGDAVRAGFTAASGDVLMILDADLTVPAEDLPKFYRALVDGKGEFINGTRLVYPMEKQAMRHLNYIANRIFSWLFSWLLNQRFTDTLCGTKVLRKKHYERIARERAYFGDFDPFGDFDLIFGAAKQTLKIVEVPIRYADRIYGETQISRFSHGWLLLRMVVFAYKKLKAF